MDDTNIEPSEYKNLDDIITKSCKVAYLKLVRFKTYKAYKVSEIKEILFSKVTY